MNEKDINRAVAMVEYVLDLKKDEVTEEILDRIQETVKSSVKPMSFGDIIRRNNLYTIFHCKNYSISFDEKNGLSSSNLLNMFEPLHNEGQLKVEASRI